MLAVVVLLTKPRHHVIVPEKYIYGLDKEEAALKTWDMNNQHKHVIFWKRDFLDDNVTPDSIDQTNFSFPPLQDFPPPEGIDSACFECRIKQFFCEYLIIYSVYGILNVGINI